MIRISYRRRVDRRGVDADHVGVEEVLLVDISGSVHRLHPFDVARAG